MRQMTLSYWNRIFSNLAMADLFLYEQIRWYYRRYSLGENFNRR